MDVGLVGTIAGAIFGSSVLSEAAKGFFSRKKVDAEASAQTSDTILKWASGLVVRIEALEKNMTEKDAEISDLKVKIAKLEAHNAVLTDAVK